MGNLHYTYKGRRRYVAVSDFTAYLVMFLVFTSWASLMALVIMAVTSVGYLPSLLASAIVTFLTGLWLRIND